MVWVWRLKSWIPDSSQLSSPSGSVVRGDLDVRAQLMFTSSWSSCSCCAMSYLAYWRAPSSLAGLALVSLMACTAPISDGSLLESPLAFEG